ncbi:hypothetical protein GJ496_006121 [Pomphorhynchus laevis]|nr:hypothetical protein GJ496_006121 [Pomphorhynchus laevis]
MPNKHNFDNPTDTAFYVELVRYDQILQVYFGTLYCNGTDKDEECVENLKKELEPLIVESPYSGFNIEINSLSIPDTEEFIAPEELTR